MEITRKVVLLGQFGVGKSSITRRYMLDFFEHDYMPTLGVQIKKKVLEMPSGKQLSMIIWDLEGFSSVAKTRASYLLGSNAYIYVFDLSRPFTYQNLQDEIDFIKEEYPQVELKIVGNKKDLVDHKKIEELLQKKNIKVDQFVSAKSGEGVKELFSTLAKKLIL